MDLRLTVLVILINFYTVKLIQGQNNNNTIKWFLLNDYLYYIETEAKFTSRETHAFCRNNDLIYTINSEESGDISKEISRLYGKCSNMWTYNHRIYEYRNEQDDHQGACLKITEKFTAAEENCNTLMGFICRTRISGGTMRFKNGTEGQISVQNVHEYCNPQSNNYDDVMDYCLIHCKWLLL